MSPIRYQSKARVQVPICE